MNRDVLFNYKQELKSVIQEKSRGLDLTKETVYTNQAVLNKGSNLSEQVVLSSTKNLLIVRSKETNEIIYFTEVNNNLEVTIEYHFKTIYLYTTIVIEELLGDTVNGFNQLKNPLKLVVFIGQARKGMEQAKEQGFITEEQYQLIKSKVG